MYEASHSLLIFIGMYISYKATKVSNQEVWNTDLLEWWRIISPLRGATHRVKHLHVVSHL